MSEVKVNKISPRTNCGTVTLGDSGDTIALGSGATQTGFGRTGTVDWQTTKKTADFTAVNGEGYFVDTGGGAVIVTLPASPAAGNIVYIKDYDGNFATASCTVARNGSNIRGATNNIVLEKNNSGAVFIYVDATEGWQIFFDGSDSDAQQTYIAATGGTTTESGDFKIHTFTGPGTFTVTEVADTTANNTLSYVVAAGGGGGGRNAGGGGGGGGFREFKGPADTYTASPLNGNPGGTEIVATATAFPVVVGGGGAGGDSSDAVQGSTSTFSTVSSAGGGRAGSRSSLTASGGSGGSGGGAAGDNTSAGSGNTPPTTPAQGTNGGASAPGATGAGGGGATVVGTTVSPTQPGGAGGAGATTSITGSPIMYAAGGGGGGYPPNPGPQVGGAGGGSGGGCGADTPSGGDNVNGTANKATGGGGGSNQAPHHPGSNGGSGVVIIRYKFQ